MARHPENRSAFLAALLARNYPLATAHNVMLAVIAMTKAAKAHKTDAELSCNIDRTAQQERAAYLRLSILAVDARSALARCIFEMGYPETATLSFGGDPRGPCGTLNFPAIPGDSFGNGFAIYK